ncbi:MAG: orotidine-5'-phosphate decarboxylase [Patescibacteria group bacterium]|nr:orotidine-5'-phosphate decarboxylase [Patescibacteria group bacterium]
MSFRDKLCSIQKKNNSLLCIGLDPELNRLPAFLQNNNNALFAFNKAIIDATSDLVCAYKPNMAFYEALGANGLKQLEDTISYLKEKHPDLPVILDGKRGDIGNTARLYAQMAFSYFNADALTVNPYLGLDSLEPFLKYQDKFIFVLVRTSNPGAKDFQDYLVGQEKLYQKIAVKLKSLSNDSQIGIVVGATYPEELKELRKLLPQTVFLIPGLGTQNGDIEKTIQYGIDRRAEGIVINVSRTIIYASDKDDFGQKAREEATKFRHLINKYRR